MATPYTVSRPDRRIGETTRHARRRSHGGRRDIAWQVLNWSWLLLVCAVVAFPVYLTFLGAFQTPADAAQGRLIPSHLTLANVRTALDTVPLARQYLVSTAAATAQTFAEVLTGALAAYALVFLQWRLRGMAFALIVATLAVPTESLVIPNYTLVTQLGLRDTIAGIVVPFLAAGYPVFLLRQAFRQVPTEVWEACRLDGASHIRTLAQIILPMTRPFLVAAALWSALGAWNGYFWPLLITDTPANRTIQVGVAQLQAADATSPTVLFAGTLLVLVPTLILVVLGQRVLLHGLRLGRSTDTH